MELTEEMKKQIDTMDYEQLLRKWRFAPVGDPMFQGEVGKYSAIRLAELRAKEPDGGAAASKRIGWD